MANRNAARVRIYDLTLEEAVQQASLLGDEMALTISVGEIWRLKKSAVSFNAWLVLDKLSCWHRRVTAALAALRYWMGTNEYAITLPVSEILKSWSGGSALLMELIEAGVLAEMYEQEFYYLVPDVTDQIAQMYSLDRDV